jgi:mannose-1-phosphate guanylyltransferase/phosphomannomutase
LSKVGADVLSINPYAQTPGMIAVDRATSEARVADAVRGSGADLGAVIDAGGEHLTLIDGTGRVLSGDQAIMVFLDLLTTESGAGSGAAPVRVVLPVTASDRAVALCAARGAEVRTSSLSLSGLMEAAAAGGVSFAADQDGGYIFPAFLPSFDASAALVALITLLARSSLSLAEVVDRVPTMPIEHAVVATPFEQKGLVMRTLMEQLADEGADLELIDGIKMRSEAGWALVVPDPEEPVTHVWAEGADRAGSNALATGFVQRVEAILAAPVSA